MDPDISGTAISIFDVINDEMDYELPGMPDYKLFHEPVDYENYDASDNCPAITNGL